MNKLMKKFLVLSLFLLVCGILVAPVSAATTQVQIVKYANDGTTILNQTTVNYTWMEAHLPVLGDGTTHYYHQGPVFVDDTNETLEQELRWNPEEDTNVDTKDMGAVKGTNLKDLCDLVGGMSSGEEVKILSSDGWNMMFSYDNVYGYSSREGPLGICWYKNGQYPDTGYSDGMRMVWFADDSVNPWGIHAFGNYDWHEAADSQYWYYYMSGGENYPTTTGLSGKYVNRIYIYSNEAPPVAPVAAFSGTPLSGPASLTVQFTDASTGTPTSWAWDFTNDGTVDSTTQNATHTYTTAGTYTVNLTVTNAGGSDSEVKTDYITVSAPALWNLNLSGVSDYIMPNTEFEALAATYPVSWTDTSSNTWTGAALWRLLAIIDDDNPATFNDTFAASGYSVQIYASDGFSKYFNSADIARNDSRIIANKMNGLDLTSTRYPLRFVGPGLSGGQMVSKIVRIELFLTITATADPNGTIVEPGTVYVPYDGSQTFISTPNTGYHVADVLVDGVSVGAVTSYDFTNVTASHTITASFAADAFAPVADFSADVTSGIAPLTVQFTDASTGSPASWAWDVNNDGSVDYTTKNATRAYTAAGTYTVNLTVTNAGGSDSEVKTDYITVNAAPVAPTLSVTPVTASLPVSGTTNYQLVMNTLPHGLAGYNLTASLDHPAIGEITAVSIPAWASLNGSSSLPADIVIFNAIDLEKQVEPGATNVVLATITVRGDTPGSSGINLTIGQMDADGGDQITPVVQNGQFTAYLPLTANFSATPLVGTLPLTVQFTDLSTGDPLPTAWAWDFNNDSIVDNTTQSPGYTYTTAGHYSVNLTTSNQFDSDTMVKSSYIWVKPNVVPFPGYTLPPTDPDGDNLYEDINGNGRLDFDDVVAFYQNMAWIEANTEVGIAPYDYNHNGRIDYDDVVVLYYEVLAAP